MQHQAEHSLPPTRPVTVEVDGEPLGVAIPEGSGIRFLAVRLSAFPFDGRIFDSVDAARTALGEAAHADDDD